MDASLSFFSRFFFGAKSLGFTAIADIVVKKDSGLAAGLANTLVMGSGVLFLPLIGWLLQINKSQVVVNDMSVYTLTDFRMALFLIPLVLFCALIMTLFIKDTYPHTVKK